MAAGRPLDKGVPKTRQVATTAPLSGGGDLSADRTLSITPGTAQQVLRTNAGATAAEWAAISALLDTLGSAVRGSVLFRDASSWAIRSPGLAGEFLQTNGSGADPQWATPATGGGAPTADDWGSDTRDADTTLVAGDDVLQEFAPTADRTCTLPAASSSARWFLVTHNGADPTHTVTIEDADGFQVLTLTPGQTAWCVCTGSQWIAHLWDTTATSRLARGYSAWALGGDASTNGNRLAIFAGSALGVTSTDNYVTEFLAPVAGKVDRIAFCTELSGSETWDIRVNGTIVETVTLSSLTAYGSYFVKVVECDVTVTAADEVTLSRASQTSDCGDLRAYVMFRTTTAGHGYSLHWGGDVNAGTYYTANGRPNNETSSVVNYTSEHAIALATTDVSMIYNTQNGDATTVFKVTVNGVVTETVTASGSAGVSALSGDSYAAADKVTIEWDSGTDPNDSQVAIEFATTGVIPLVFQGDVGAANDPLRLYTPEFTDEPATADEQHGFIAPYRMTLACYSFNGLNATNVPAKVRINGVVDQSLAPGATPTAGALTTSGVLRGDVIEMTADSASAPAMRYQLLLGVIAE